MASLSSFTLSFPFALMATFDRLSTRATAAIPRNGRMVDTIKWTASVAQILGYTATGFGWTPWSIGFFLVGLLGWLAVGVLWRDKALVLVHVCAFAAMMGGLISR